MHIEARFFATFREAVGQKILDLEYDGDTVTAREVLEDLVDRYPDLEFFDEEGELREYLNIMRNGRDVTLLDGLETTIEDGDRLSLFPPVAGGATGVDG